MENELVFQEQIISIKQCFGNKYFSKPRFYSVLKDLFPKIDEKILIVFKVADFQRIYDIHKELDGLENNIKNIRIEEFRHKFTKESALDPNIASLVFWAFLYGNSINCDKFIQDNSNTKFNKAFALLNSADSEMDLNQDFLFEIENTPDYRTKMSFKYESKRMNDITYSRDLLISVIADRPNFATTYELMGIVSMRLEEFNESIEYFSKAISLQPFNKFTLANRGTVKIHYLKDYQGGIDDFTSSLKIDAENNSVLLKRARAFLFTKQITNVISDCNHALLNSNTDVLAYKYRALANAIDDKQTESIEDYSIYMKTETKAINIFEYVKAYIRFGFKITHITSSENKFNYRTINRLKHPSHEYNSLFSEKQPLFDVLQKDWINADGVGTLTSVNGLFVLDIDGCNSIEFVDALLINLGLSRDYKWISKSGSLNGFHIFLFGVNKPIKYSGVACTSHKPNRNYFGSFSKLELLWRTHVVLPPSLHKTGGSYSFINGIPKERCAIVDLSSIDRALSDFIDKKQEVNKKQYYEN